MTEKDCGQNDRVSGRLHIKKLHESEVIKRLEWETLLFIDIVRLSDGQFWRPQNGYLRRKGKKQNE